MPEPVTVRVAVLTEVLACKVLTVPEPVTVRVAVLTDTLDCNVFTVEFPVTIASPETCKLAEGLLMPIPSLPVASSRIFSTLLLTKTVANAVVLPMYKLFGVYTYAFVSSLLKYNGIEDAAEPAIVSLKFVAGVPIPTSPSVSL